MIRTLAPLLAASLVVAGCTLAMPPAGTDALAGRTFLSTVVRQDGADRPLVPGSRIRLSFTSDGQLGASAGCNSIGGSFALDGGVLRFREPRTTAMGCDPARHAQDEWLTAFLATGPVLALAGNELVLAAAGTEVRLVDEETISPDLPLVGPLWAVESVVTGDLAVGFGPHLVATLRFAEDGAVAIESGCNQGGASATIADATLTFGEIGLTRRACLGAAAEMERSVLAVLRAPAVSWSIDADVLTLHAGDEGLVLRAR